MTMLHIIKHQFRDSWAAAWAILPPHPHSGDNEGEESNLIFLGEWQENQLHVVPGEPFFF